jgi:glyoxylate reductase
MKPKVLILHRLLPEAIAYLEEQADCEINAEARCLTKMEILRKVRDKDGLLSLLVDKIDREIIDAGTSLKIIANCAVGYNNIDVPYARKKGIWVSNTPGVLTETTADLTWALIFSVARKIPQADRFTRAGKFRGWELDLFLGKEITRKRLGIVGMGRIGKAVALRAHAFQMEVMYSDTHRLTPEEENRYGAEFLALDELLSTSDVVSIHVSLDPQTHHLISEEKLSLLKKEAILVNVSRGPVVDERALAKALEDHWFWGAGLDVYEREPSVEEKLLSLDNVVLLPHIGSATYETRLKMAMMAAENLVQGAKGKLPKNLVWS